VLTLLREYQRWGILCHDWQLDNLIATLNSNVNGSDSGL